MIVSKDYPCVYWNDGKCKKFSDENITSWCVWSPCASQTRSNADRIRAMSDKELAEFIVNIKARAAFCKAVGNNEAFEKLCSGEWLQQPAKEADNEAD